MPGLVSGIHVLAPDSYKDVNGRDKPGHDARVFDVTRQSYRVCASIVTVQSAPL
jgi:hypothetical protein